MKKSTIKPWELNKCPLTNLPITNKSEWTNLTFNTDNYKVTFSLIGKNTIHVKTWGSSTLYTTKKYFAFLEKIVDEEPIETITEPTRSE